MPQECIFCGAALLSGTAIGFDPARGRLWSICASCSRWNLAPMETRWETVEELEKQTHDGGHLLAQTAHISLFALDSVDVIRVGAASLREEAWWRYGDTLRHRYRRAASNRRAEIGIFLVLGIPLSITGVQRWQTLGRAAWRGRRQCESCGARLEKISFGWANSMRIEADKDGLCLSLGCPKCGVRERGTFVFSGSEAQQILRRALLHCNFAGAAEPVVDAALTEIERAGAPDEYVARVSAGRPTIGLLRNYDSVNAVALEISVNESNERAQLHATAKLLEKQWQEEAVLADIIDNELT